MSFMKAAMFKSLEMLKVVITLLCVTSTAHASDLAEDSNNANSTVVKICEGVYAGKGYTARGEPIYFGMELLDKTNSHKWYRYLSDTKEMVKHGEDNFRSDDSLRDAIEKLSQGSASSDPQSHGFTEQEQQEFIGTLIKNGYAKHADKKLYVFAGICDGIGGFQYRPDDGRRYVAYVSKKPVVGKYPFFGQSADGHYLAADGSYHRIRIKEYIDVYADLVMCVGVHDIPHSLKYHIRGIFKNPISLIRNDYKGAAIPLQAFTAVAALQFFEGKRFMSVAPMLEMHQILCKTFQANQMYIAKNIFNYRRFPFIPDNLSIISTNEGERKYMEEFSQDSESSEYDRNYCEREHLVRIEALIGFYK